MYLKMGRVLQICANNGNFKLLLGMINKCLLGVLFVSQGVHLLYSRSFFNFKGQPFVEAGQVSYILGPLFIVYGIYLIQRTLCIRGRTGADKSPSNELKDNVLYGHQCFPTQLKFAIFYFILYALLVESLVILNWQDWLDYIDNKSWGAQIGYLMQGPLLGLLFAVAATGLIFGKKWGRKWAIAGLIFAIIADTKGLAWGYSGGVSPTSVVYITSLLVVSVWNSIWLFLLFSKKSSLYLRE